MQVWHSLRPLYLTMLIAQALGAAAGLWLAVYPSWFESLWAGAALATLPGYLLGLPLQRRLRPRHFHAPMLRRIGLAAVVLFLAVFAMPFGR